MGLDKPQPFIHAAQHLGEQVGRTSVPQFVPLIDGAADFMPKGGQSLRDCLDMRPAIGNRQRILDQTSAGGGGAKLGPLTFQCACFICIWRFTASANRWFNSRLISARRSGAISFPVGFMCGTSGNAGFGVEAGKVGVFMG